MMKDLTSLKLIQLNLLADDWEDAVAQAALPLVQEGKIESRYIYGIIDSAKESGPYFVIMPQVALPHARPEQGAIKSAIGIATLSIPVDFGSEENDPVKYLFTLSAVDSESHLSALVQLAELLENQAFFECLDQAKDPTEVMNFLNQIG